MIKRNARNTVIHMTLTSKFLPNAIICLHLRGRKEADKRSNVTIRELDTRVELNRLNDACFEKENIVRKSKLIYVFAPCVIF